MLLKLLSHTNSISSLQFLLPASNICFPSFSSLWHGKLKICTFWRSTKWRNCFLIFYHAVHDFIRWLNSSNSDTTSDCVSLPVLFSPSYYFSYKPFCQRGNLYCVMILQWDIEIADCSVVFISFWQRRNSFAVISTKISTGTYSHFLYLYFPYLHFSAPPCKHPITELKFLTKWPMGTL